MSNFWWLEPSWKETLCARCGKKIWPEGDPDHGVCYDCYFSQQKEQRYYRDLEEELYARWVEEEEKRIMEESEGSLS